MDFRDETKSQLYCFESNEAGNVGLYRLNRTGADLMLERIENGAPEWDMLRPKFFAADESRMWSVCDGQFKGQLGADHCCIDRWRDRVRTTDATANDAVNGTPDPLCPAPKSAKVAHVMDEIHNVAACNDSLDTRRRRGNGRCVTACTEQSR